MKILIIEDEEKLAKHIKRGLEQEGFIIESCYDGQVGQEYIELKHETLDLIILDLALPGIEGVQLCKNIRAQNIVVPVIMLTAKDAQEDIVAGLDAGGDDYLTKPFSFDILLARIRAILRRPKISVNEAITIKNITLNIKTRQVTCNEKELILTLKEFNLLEYLMEHPNEVLEREQILDKIWDINFNSFSNVVDVHIKNLRKKLEDAHYATKLETVRGVGYRIKA